MMKLTKRIILLWAINTSPFFSMAQLPCGTEDPISTIRFTPETLESEWQNLNNGSRQTSRKFMVAAHIIRSNAGTSGISSAAVMEAITTMNEHYELAKIEFELCGDIRYIDDNTYLETTDSESSGLVTKYNVANVINIYFIPKVLSSTGAQLCGNATLPSGNVNLRRIFMANSCAVNGSTLSHEMGHFFGMLHTHSTTDGIEYVERINCHDRGDGFCDTPADPELDGDNVENCVYIGNAKDPQGVRYMPDPSNFMSYAPKSCRYNFTSEQIAYLSLVANSNNDYIYESCDIGDILLSSNTSEEILLEDFSTLDIPFSIDGNQFEKSQEVSYEVTVLNSHSNIEKVIKSGVFFIAEGTTKQDQKFSFDISNDIINASTITIKIDSKNLIPEINEKNNDLTYYLRHDYTINRSSFLFPNPTNDELTFYISNNKKSKLTTSVVDLSGKLVMQTTIDKKDKSHMSSINVSELSQGMYFLIIELDSKTKDVLKFVKL